MANFNKHLKQVNLNVTPKSKLFIMSTAILLALSINGLNNGSKALAAELNQVETQVVTETEVVSELVVTEEVVEATDQTDVASEAVVSASTSVETPVEAEVAEPIVSTEAEVTETEKAVVSETTVIEKDVEPVAADSIAEKVGEATVIRYDGANREEVAINVAKEHFKDAKKVILVNRDKFPDAISATNISQGDYPVLYTRDNRVDGQTLTFLKSLNLEEIFVLGGEKSVNQAVLNQIQNETNTKVSRFDGRDRYIVNIESVKETFSQADNVVIASGEIYTDALYGVSYANAHKIPVILTQKNNIKTETMALIKSLQAKKATIIGGFVTLAQNIESALLANGVIPNRIAGANRYDGSADVAYSSYEKPTTVVIASGEVFSDALVAAPLAQKYNATILLSRNNRIDPKVEKYLNDGKLTIQDVYILGGTKTINKATADAISHAVQTTTIVPDKILTEIEVPSLVISNNSLKAGNTARVSVNVTDDEQVGNVYVWHLNPSTKKLVRTDLFKATGVTYSGNINVTTATPKGFWQLQYIDAYDTAKNLKRVSILNNDLSAGDYQVS